MYVRVCVEERGGLKIIDVRVFDIRCDVYVFLKRSARNKVFLPYKHVHACGVDATTTTSPIVFTIHHSTV